MQNEYVIPTSGLRGGGTETVVRLEGSAPGLIIHEQLYKNGDWRPNHIEYTITRERSGLALSQFIPNLDTARKLTAAMVALPIGWELSKPTIRKQFDRMDYQLKLWLFSVMSMEGDTVN